MRKKMGGLLLLFKMEGPERSEQKEGSRIVWCKGEDDKNGLKEELLSFYIAIGAGKMRKNVAFPEIAKMAAMSSSKFCGHTLTEGQAQTKFKEFIDFAKRFTGYDDSKGLDFAHHILI